MAGEPSHVDVSVLYLPLMPETSKLGEAMVKAGQDATESFGKGSAGIGDKIHESFSKSKDKIKDVFHRSGSDAAEAMADGVKEKSGAVEDAVAGAGEKAKGKFRESAKDWGKVLVDAVGPDTKKLLGDRLEETVGSALEGVLGDNAKWAGKFSHTVADWGFDELKTKLGGVKDAADNTKAAFASFKEGNTSEGVSKLVDGFGKLGVEVKDLPQPVQDVIGKVNEAKSVAQEFADVFTNLPGKIGNVASKLAELGTPLTMLVATLYQLRDLEKQGLFDKTTPDGKEDWWKLAAGDLGGLLEDKYNMAVHGHHAAGKEPQAPLGTFVDVPPSERLLSTSGSDTTLGLSGGDTSDVLGSGSDAYNFFSSGQSLPSPGSDKGLNLSTIPAAAQKYANDCIDASARIILSHSGVNMTEDQLMGVIAPGGTIDSQAAGLNKLNPAGGYRAMPGSGGDAASMFAAIKASIDSGTGSILNVAPGSSIAGRQFSEGHFIAATGYNPDGTINLSDTAGGTKYSVSAADAFQATRGRGIVAGTGAGPAGGAEPASPLVGGSGGGSGRGSITAPIGNQHDPIYTTSVSPDGTPSGAGGDPAQQFGQSLLGGVAQSLGLDGSVFKTFGGASNPLDFGATKMGMGLLNWGMGLAQQKGGGRMPGMGGSIPGAAGLGESPTRGSGGYTNTNNTHIDNSMTVNGPTDVPSLKNMQNASDRAPSAMAGPAFSGLP